MLVMWYSEIKAIRSSSEASSYAQIIQRCIFKARCDPKFRLEEWQRTVDFEATCHAQPFRFQSKHSIPKGTYRTRATIDPTLSKSVVALNNLVDRLANVSEVEDVLKGICCCRDLGTSWLHSRMLWGQKRRLLRKKHSSRQIS